jgi:hypothetical protein
MWNMTWRFLMLNGEHFRMQAVTVAFGDAEPDEEPIMVGYLSHADGTADIDTVRFELAVHATTRSSRSAAGVHARYENGAEVPARSRA